VEDSKSGTTSETTADKPNETNDKSKKGKKQKKEEKKEEQMDVGVSIDDSQASNNWVIHGNYTKTGKPLIAGDPHLTN
jgi:penicillin G amidase